MVLVANCDVLLNQGAIADVDLSRANYDRAALDQATLANCQLAPFDLDHDAIMNRRARADLDTAASKGPERRSATDTHCMIAVNLRMGEAGDEAGPSHYADRAAQS